MCGYLLFFFIMLFALLPAFLHIFLVSFCLRPPWSMVSCLAWRLTCEPPDTRRGVPSAMPEVWHWITLEKRPTVPAGVSSRSLGWQALHTRMVLVFIFFSCSTSILGSAADACLSLTQGGRTLRRPVGCYLLGCIWR